MTTSTAAVADVARRGTGPARVAASGWWAVAAAAGVLAALLLATGVDGRDVVVFGVHAVLAVVAPGVVAWRLAVPGGPRPLAVDASFGAGVGVALQVLAYLPARAVGLPELHLLLPLALFCCLALPAARRRVLVRAPRAPAWWSWATASSVVVVAAYAARALWFPRPLAGDAVRAPYVDQPYHLALVGELRHHVPSEVPFVAGDRLFYHWFVHAEVAATSWGTGIEPVVLLERLSMLPLIAAGVAGSAALAWWLGRSWVAACLPPVVLALSAGPLVPAAVGELYTTAVLYLSPTTTLAQALLPALVALVVLALRQGVRALGTGWVLLVLLLAVSAGAKGSTLPMLVAALVAVALVCARRRAVTVAALVIAALAGGCVLLAQRWVYGSGAQGLGLGLFGIGDQLGTRSGLVATEAQVTAGVGAALTVVWVAGWVAGVAGLFGLLGRDRRGDPAAWLALMFVGAGLGAVVVLASRSGNQLYFPRVAPTVAAAGAAWGLQAWCTRRPPLGRVAGWCLVGGVAVGLVVLLLTGGTSPVAPGTRLRELLWPLVPLVVATVAVAVAVALAVRVAAAPRRVVLVVVAISVVTGAHLAPGVDGAARWLSHPQDWRAAVVRPTPFTEQIGPGGVPAARWLRDHSDPDDLVATNQHCRRASSSGRNGRCDNRSFWISGYAERRVLVEGWAYSWRTGARAAETGLPSCCIPFWDQRRLRANDLAISDPTAARLELLRSRYGVRWLFVSTVHGDGWRGLAGLPDQVRTRYRAGDYVVLELR